VEEVGVGRRCALRSSRRGQRQHAETAGHDSRRWHEPMVRSLERPWQAPGEGRRRRAGIVGRRETSWPPIHLRTPDHDAAFMTKVTVSSAAMSRSGSPSTAMISAKRPTSSDPMRSPHPRTSAAVAVAARMVAPGDSPERTSAWNIVLVACTGVRLVLSNALGWLLEEGRRADPHRTAGLLQRRDASLTWRRR